MFDLKDLAAAKQKVQQKRQETSGSAYDEAVKILEDFENNDNEPDKELLVQATDKLIEALQFDPEKVEAYICLSYIYYVLGDDQNALKYLDISEKLFEEDLPEDLQEFKNNIKANINFDDINHLLEGDVEFQDENA